MDDAVSDPESKTCSSGLVKKMMRTAEKFLLVWVLIWPSISVAASETASRIIAGPHIVVGGDHNSPPYEFLDEQGEPSGFNVELFQTVAETIGLAVEFQLGPWSEVKQALEKGEIDAVTSMPYTPEQDRLVEFSKPYTIIHHGVFARRGTFWIESLTDLQKKRVIVQRDSILHEFAVDSGLSEELVLVENLPDALRLLASGAHDYALVLGAVRSGEENLTG